MSIKKILIIKLLIVIFFSHNSCSNTKFSPLTGEGEPVTIESVNIFINSNIQKFLSAVNQTEPSTLKGIKVKYGKIDVITLFNGRVIRGVIKSRGETFAILTTDGILYVKAGQVMKTGRE